MAKLFCLLISCWLVLASCSDFVDLYSKYRKGIETFERYTDRQHDLKDIISQTQDMLKKFEDELDTLIETDYVTNFEEIQKLFKRRQDITDQLYTDKQELASIRFYFDTISTQFVKVIVDYHRSLQDSLLKKFRLASRRNDLRRVLLLRDRMDDSTWFYNYANQLLRARNSHISSRRTSSLT